MPRLPQVRVRDKETGAEYLVSEARYKRTPDLWDRIEPVPAKQKTTVKAAAAAKHSTTASGQQADPNKEEN